MEQTLEQRCKVALECLPDARYRTMLARLFDELLARAAVPVVQLQEPVAVDATEQRRALLVGEWDWSEVAGEPAASAECAATQRHITDMLVAHRDMIEAQQRGDGEAEVLAVRRMEAARSAVAGASPCRPRQTDTGEEQLEPFWCHEQSHDRARCETQCAECAEDGTAGESMDGHPMPSLDEMMAVVRLYATNPTPHNEFKVRCALRDGTAQDLEQRPQVRALMARAYEEGADAMERAAIEAVREHERANAVKGSDHG